MTTRGAFRSQDGGRSWPPGALFPVAWTGRTILRVAATDRDRLHLANGPDLLVSEDAGATWTQLQPAEGERLSFHDVAVDPRTGTACAATARGCTGSP